MGSILEKISKGFREVPLELERFLKNKYPAFVTDGNLERIQDEVPVFMFHTANPVVLESQLEYLKTNGYQTLNLETFMAFLQGETQLKSPSVLLTFDDGEKSWYDVAYPLLKRYGFNAVGFVVPHYIQEKPSSRTSGKTWLSWSELIELEQSGVMEIESHSYYHARIFVEPKLVDFFHPSFPDSLGLDVPWIENNGSYTNKLQLGTPIYSYAPRLEGHARLIDNSEVREACISWVKCQGESEFFQRSTWKKELTDYYKNIQNSLSSVEYESESQTREQMLSDLVKAKTVLSERLNKPIQHFCYPWGIGGEQVVKLSQEAGYISNFWVTLNQRNTNRSGDSPFYVPRLKDDYLFRLPGKGRYSLLKIFKAKLQRRAKTVEIY